MSCHFKFSEVETHIFLKTSPYEPVVALSKAESQRCSHLSTIFHPLGTNSCEEQQTCYNFAWLSRTPFHYCFCLIECCFIINIARDRRHNVVIAWPVHLLTWHLPPHLMLLLLRDLLRGSRRRHCQQLGRRSLTEVIDAPPLQGEKVALGTRL